MLIYWCLIEGCILPLPTPRALMLSYSVLDDEGLIRAWEILSIQAGSSLVPTGAAQVWIDSLLFKELRRAAPFPALRQTEPIANLCAFDLYEMIPGFAVGFLVTIGVSRLTRPPEGAASDIDEMRKAVGGPFKRGQPEPAVGRAT